MPGAAADRPDRTRHNRWLAIGLAAIAALLYLAIEFRWLQGF